MLKKRYALLLLIPALLSACGKNGAGDIGERIQEYYRGAGSCSMQASVTADYADRVTEYGLLYEKESGAQSGTVTVLAPEEIRGLKASWDEDKSTLSYEDAILETGGGGDLTVTPVSVLPLLLENWAGGYVTDTGAETYEDVKCCVLSSGDLEGDTKVEYRTWFEQESFQPLLSEVYLDGRLFITCEFERSTFGSEAG